MCSGCQRVDRLEQLILDITSRAMAIDLGKLSIPTLRSLELNRSSTGMPLIYYYYMPLSMCLNCFRDRRVLDAMSYGFPKPSKAHHQGPLVLLHYQKIFIAFLSFSLSFDGYRPR